MTGNLPVRSDQAGAMRTIPWWASILFKQGLFVGALVVLTCTAVSLIGYQFARSSLRDQIHKRLNAVAHDRDVMLSAFVAQQKERIALVASRTQLRRLLDQHLRDPQSLPDFLELSRPILVDANKSTEGFRNIWIADPAGKVVTATDDSYLADEYGSDPEFVRGRSNEHLGVPYLVDGEYRALLTAPTRLDDVFLGVVMVEIDMTPLVDLLRDRKELERSAEVLVGTVRDGQVHYLFAPSDDPQHTVVAVEQAAAMQRAALHEETDYGTVVYEGTEVLAAWRPVEYQPRGVQPWGMVVKIDAAEAYAPVGRLARALVFTELALLAVGLLMGYLLARRFARPLLALADTAGDIAAGQLTSRAKIHSQDEIGRLGFAFNHMLEQLSRARETLERRVQERTEELQRSNKELDEFAYITSHDLKEPLRGIANYVTFIGNDYADKLDDNGHEMLDTLKRLCQRMTDLIDALLYYSRVGRAELAVQETDLNAMLAEVLDTLHVTLEEQAVEVVIPAPLPAIECDGVRVAEVFRNLITNAYKYNDKPQKRIEIGYLDGESSAAQQNGPPVFYVRDNGIGIREKHLDAIFRMFKRLHARDKFGGGTGAGLTFVKRIIERHGGKIWVESAQGEGTTFYFTLQ